MLKQKNCLVLVLILIIFSIAVFLIALKTDIVNSIVGKLDSIGKTERTSDSSKSSNSSKYSPMTSGELVNYFSVISTTQKDKTVSLRKWNKPIKVEIEGMPDQKSLELIDQFIARFNKNSQTIKMHKVESGGNFIVQFRDKTINNLPGSAAFGAGKDCFILGAVVEIGPEAGMLETLPEYTINHEMFHALGFGGHYRSNVSCTLMSAKHCAGNWTENEDKLVDMLYNSNIPACSNETQIKNFFLTK